MENMFVIGDLHGEKEKMKELLKYWKPDKEKLILLGDLVDRGKESFGVIWLAKKLQEEYGAIVIGGNHDAMFLNWLEDPYGEYDLFYPQGGKETINSFFERKVDHLYLPDHIAKLLKKQFPLELNFLKNLPDYYENGEYVMVHGGVNLAYENWKNTSSNDFRWIREPFHYGRNDTGKIFIFGHTITRRLNRDKSDNVWVSPCGTKIGIDGGSVYGGLLHGLRVNENHDYEVLSVAHNKDVLKSKLVIPKEKVILPF